MPFAVIRVDRDASLIVRSFFRNGPLLRSGSRNLIVFFRAHTEVVMNSQLSLAAARMAATVSMGAAVFLGAEQAIAAPVAIAPYTLTTFNGVPPSGADHPDDLAISADGKTLWVGYGNNVKTDGTGGPSNLVEYDIGSGPVLKNISIPRHPDGLKINPSR